MMKNSITEGSKENLISYLEDVLNLGDRTRNSTILLLKKGVVIISYFYSFPHEVKVF